MGSVFLLPTSRRKGGQQKDAAHPTTVRLSSNKFVRELKKIFGPAQEIKSFNVKINCSFDNYSDTTFTFYVWDWERDEPPTDMQFNWLPIHLYSCEVPKETAIFFRKLYKLAKKRNVSFKELVMKETKNK